MAALHTVQLGSDLGEKVRETNLDPVASVESSGACDVNAYCENKLQSLSEGELQILAKVNEESFAQILVGQSSSSAAAVVVNGRNEKVVRGRSRVQVNSTPVKNLIGSNDASSVGVGSGESVVKPSVGVALRIGEREESICGERFFDR